jgi:hypothetical protein
VWAHSIPVDVEKADTAFAMSQRNCIISLYIAYKKIIHFRDFARLMMHILLKILCFKEFWLFAWAGETAPFQQRTGRGKPGLAMI